MYIIRKDGRTAGKFHWGAHRREGEDDASRKERRRGERSKAGWRMKKSCRPSSGPIRGAWLCARRHTRRAQKGKRSDQMARYNEYYLLHLNELSPCNCGMMHPMICEPSIEPPSMLIPSYPPRPHSFIRPFHFSLPFFKRSDFTRYTQRDCMYLVNSKAIHA